MTVPLSKAVQGYGSDFIRELFSAVQNPVRGRVYAPA